MVFCNHEGCPNSYITHKWGKIRASEQGWFIKGDGQSWCPDHTPDWVEEWRKNGMVRSEERKGI